MNSLLMSPEEFAREKQIAPRRIRFERLLGDRPLPRGPNAGKRVDRCVVNALLGKDRAAQIAMHGFLWSLYRAITFGADPGLKIYNTREDLGFFMERALSILGQAPSCKYLGVIEGIMVAISASSLVPGDQHSAFDMREVWYYRLANLYLACYAALGDSRPFYSFWAGVCRAYIALPHSRQAEEAP